MEWMDAARAAFDRVVQASGGRLLEPFEAYSHYMEFAGSHWLTSSPHEKPPPEKANVTTNVTNKGDNNFVFVGHGGVLPRIVRFRGAHNVISLGAHCAVRNAVFDVQGEGSLTYVGAFTTLDTAAAIYARSPATVTVGDHCYIGERVQVSGSDHHGIYSRTTRQRINNNRDVLIDDGAFLGADVRVNKGVVIEHGGIVLAGSIVAGVIRSRCAYHGVPARLVHEDVAWAADAERFDDLDLAIANAQAATDAKVAALKARIAAFPEDGVP